MKKHIRLIVTIIVSIVEVVLYVVFLDRLSPIINNPSLSNIAALLFPSGAIYIVNYFILAPAILWVVYKCQDIIGFRKLVGKIDTIIDGCVRWFDGMHVKWAPYATATDFDEEHRIANMFEITISLYKTERHKSKPVLYENKMDFLYDSASECGWYSRSLGTTLGDETVVCTSLGLYAFGLQHNENTDPNKTKKLNDIARCLWDCRTENGWGVFLTKHPPHECRLANTFWALRALSLYMCDDPEYMKFVLSIYERASNSQFGFHSSDISSLCVTAMYLLLFFELPVIIQKELKLVYNPKEAAQYVYNKFCHDNIQCESEDLPGIKKVDKVPWQHITVSYALESLCIAYSRKMLSLFQFQLLATRINSMLDENVKIDDDKCHYKPNGMQIHPKGMNTFPTAYLIIGIHSFRNAATQRRMRIHDAFFRKQATRPPINASEVESPN